MIMGRSTIPVNLTGGGLFIADKANFVLVSISDGYNRYVTIEFIDI